MEKIQILPKEYTSNMYGGLLDLLSFPSLPVLFTNISCTPFLPYNYLPLGATVPKKSDMLRGCARLNDGENTCVCNG